jgi:hypothetical protein
MFRGVNLDGASYVSGYADALALLEKRAKRSRKVAMSQVLKPGGDETPLGHPRSEVTGIRMDSDEVIRFRLYSTDVIRVHPDDTITVEGYPTITTSAFANTLLPSGMHLAGEIMHFDDLVCNVYHPVRFTKTSAGWRPNTDDLGVQCLSTASIDRKLSREVHAEYAFKELADFAAMASRHMTIEHEGQDYEVCAFNLREKRFREAVERLPTFKDKQAFGSDPIVWPVHVPGTEVVGPSSIERLKRYLMHKHGALTIENYPILTYTQWRRARSLVKALENSGVWNHRMRT